jgi:hypothetical protein
VPPEGREQLLQRGGFEGEGKWELGI